MMRFDDQSELLVLIRLPLCREESGHPQLLRMQPDLILTSLYDVCMCSHCCLAFLCTTAFYTITVLILNVLFHLSTF